MHYTTLSAVKGLGKMSLIAQAALLLGALSLISCPERTSEAHPNPISSITPAIEVTPASRESKASEAAEEPLRYVFAPKSALIWRSRSTKSKLLGLTVAGARLPVYEEAEQAKSGCKGPWLRVQYGGWVCSVGLLPSVDGEETEEHFENRLPKQSAVVTKDTPRYAQPGGEVTGEEKAKTKVKVTRIFALNGETYAQLKANVFVSAEDLDFKGRGTPSTLKGVYFDKDTKPPIVFFVAKNTPLYSKAGITNPKEAVAHRSRYEREALLEETTIKGKRYLRTEGGWFVKKGVAVVSLEERPKDVPAEGRWVLIDLSEQTLSVYEGDELVFATLVSTGKEGHKGAFRTVKGTFQIQSKYRYDTMEGNRFGEEYKVEDVPWAQYFHGGFAVHGTFWHDRFGAVASHGCVNLSAQDAKFVSDFLAPELPPGWLVIFPTPQMNPSTIVVRQ